MNVVTKGFGRAWRMIANSRAHKSSRRGMKRSANRHFRRIVAQTVHVHVKSGEYDFDPIPRRYKPVSDWDVI